MAEHRVFAHLGLVARDYDAQIRRWIPAYETMIDVVVGLVPGGDILDLGTGTGALAAAILDKRSDTRVTLVDIDPAMLEVARERVTPHAARVEVVTATFEGGLRPCDAVVASLALHHVADRDAKQRLYATIFAALRPGGCRTPG